MGAVFASNKLSEMLPIKGVLLCDFLIRYLLYQLNQK